MTPVVLHLTRPYRDEEEYLAAEAWTIDSRGMLLLEQAALEPETIVAFDVALANGVKVIRAEARVLPATSGQAPGVRVRFRRFGAQTKAFIDRALAAREEQLVRVTPSSSPPPAEPAPREGFVTADAGIVRRAADSPEPARVLAQANKVVPRESPRSDALSGVHPRPAAPIVAPANRDELLDRLRRRAAQGIASASGAERGMRVSARRTS